MQDKQKKTFFAILRFEHFLKVIFIVGHTKVFFYLHFFVPYLICLNKYLTPFFPFCCAVLFLVWTWTLKITKGAGE